MMIINYNKSPHIKRIYYSESDTKMFKYLSSVIDTYDMEIIDLFISLTYLDTIKIKRDKNKQ